VKARRNPDRGALLLKLTYECFKFFLNEFNRKMITFLFKNYSFNCFCLLFFSFGFRGICLNVFIVLVDFVYGFFLWIQRNMFESIYCFNCFCVLFFSFVFRGMCLKVFIVLIVFVYGFCETRTERKCWSLWAEIWTHHPQLPSPQTWQTSSQKFMTDVTDNLRTTHNRRDKHVKNGLSQTWQTN
jgi:hypothetical protein